MNIFNISWKNKKIIIINIDSIWKTNRTITNSKYCINYYNDKIISINIFDETITNKYDTGCLYPNEKLLNKIYKITNVNLLNFKNYSNILVGKIIKTTKIENTHLTNCIVDIKSNKLNIVCGAKNAKENLITVVALSNSIIPIGKLIKSGKLLGNESNGMLCSWKELNIHNNLDGIIELDKAYENKIGKSFNIIYKNIN